MKTEGDLLACLVEPQRRILFYPCCGRDLESPLRHFINDCDTFFFVNLQFTPTVRGGLMRFLRRELGLRLLSRETSGPPEPRDSGAFRDYKPYVVKEVYRRREDGREITILRKRGFARYTFKHSLHHIDVFFHRGDSEGEGGSCVRWLGKTLALEVFSKIRDGGLIVTDGSLCTRQRPWKRMKRFHRKDLSGTEAVALAETFSYQDRSFSCVGHIDNRYGPTLLWRVG